MSLNNFDYSVDWFDFTSMSERPEGKNEDAEITARYRYNYRDVRNGRSVIPDGATVVIEIYVSRTSETWAVESRMNETLLEHEQGHYDITAIGARDFERDMLTQSAGSSRELRIKIGQLNGNIIQKIAVANNRYDTLTRHLEETAVQQSWQRSIASIKANVNGTLDDLP